MPEQFEGEQTPTFTNYDNLLNPDNDLSQQSVEAAAVPPEQSVPVTAEQQQPAGGQQEPLTMDQLVAKRGGAPVSQDQLDGINKARLEGKHLS